MAPKPERRRNPLQTSWWTYPGVMGNCVVARVMQEMSPLVDVARSSLDDFLPLAAALNADHAFRNQNSHQFVRWDLVRILYDNQVDQIVRVR